MCSFRVHLTPNLLLCSPLKKDRGRKSPNCTFQAMLYKVHSRHAKYYDNVQLRRYLIFTCVYSVKRLRQMFGSSPKIRAIMTKQCLANLLLLGFFGRSCVFFTFQSVLPYCTYFCEVNHMSAASSATILACLCHTDLTPSRHLCYSLLVSACPF